MSLVLVSHIGHNYQYLLIKVPIVSTVTVFTDTISYYDRDSKDNHTFNHFHLASGMTLSTVKGVILNLVHLGRCYYRPKCLYRHTGFLYRHKYSFPSRTQKCFFCILYL